MPAPAMQTTGIEGRAESRFWRGFSIAQIPETPAVLITLPASYQATSPGIGLQSQQGFGGSGAESCGVVEIIEAQGQKAQQGKRSTTLTAVILRRSLKEIAGLHDTNARHQQTSTGGSAPTDTCRGHPRQTPQGIRLAHGSGHCAPIASHARQKPRPKVTAADRGSMDSRKPIRLKMRCQ